MGGLLSPWKQASRAGSARDSKFAVAGSTLINFDFILLRHTCKLAS